MSKYYNSKFYSKPIEVINNDWNVMVIISDDIDRKVIYSRYNILEKYSESDYINKCLLWLYLQNNIKKVLVIWAWWAWEIPKDLINDNIFNNINLLLKKTWVFSINFKILQLL